MTKLNNSVELPQTEFPIDAFPKEFRDLMHEYNRVHKYNYDYMSAGLLFSLSLGIGKIFMLKYREDWIESALLWIVICGPTGSNKTAPIALYLKYFEEKDNDNYKDYRKEKRKAEKSNKTVFPKKRQNILGDFTPESIAKVLNDNPRGVGIVADEILSWTKNFNRYAQSGEESNYLSMWSQRPLVINRKNGDDEFILKPYVPVVGGIQPNLLHHAFGNGRLSSGFFHRILFFIPKDVRKEAGSRDDIDQSLLKVYRKSMDNILSSEKLIKDDEISTGYYKLSEKAEDLFFDWKLKYDKVYNDSKDDHFKGIISKMEIYLLRISLILQVSEDAISCDFSMVVESKAFENAIKIVQYFEATSLKALNILTKYADPLAPYPRNKQILYNLLPEKFSKQEGIKLSKKHNMRLRTFEYFIADTYLFERIDTGLYEKKH